MLAHCVMHRILRHFIVVTMLICGGISGAFAETPVYKPYGRTVVLDPGHGGQDTGARGPEGSLEKTVTLTFAQLITAELETHYRVVLTRTGDYELDIPSRTAVANQEKADLFISIHTGGSYLHQASGLYIFYFKDLPGISEPATNQSEAGNLRIWDTLQSRHQSASAALARQLEKHLIPGEKFKFNGILAAPLMVVRGADMPAVLIEIGYLTNPLEEKMLREKGGLSDLAKRIAKGITDYLGKSP